MSLGIAYQNGDLVQARTFTSRALAADPMNPVALKKRGVIFGQEGDTLQATTCTAPMRPIPGIRRSYTVSPSPLWSSATLGRSRSTSRWCWICRPKRSCALAKNGLREIAVRAPKSRWLRLDASFYLPDVMQ